MLRQSQITIQDLPRSPEHKRRELPIPEGKKNTDIFYYPQSKVKVDTSDVSTVKHSPINFPMFKGQNKTMKEKKKISEIEFQNDEENISLKVLDFKKMLKITQ